MNTRDAMDDEKKPLGKPFEKGHPKLGGRVKGARNVLSADLLSALAEDFRQHGPEVVRIVRMESPKDYLKVISSVLPKEFEINDNRLKDIPDDQIDAFIEFAQRYLAGRAHSIEGGEDETAHRKPAGLLPALQETG